MSDTLSRHVILFFVLTMLILPPVARAQVTPGQALGTLSVSASSTYWQPEISATAFTPFSVYLMLELDYGDIGHPEFNAGVGVLAWEASFIIPPEFSILSTTVRNIALNVGTNTNLIVGLGSVISTSATPTDLVAYSIGKFTPGDPVDVILDIGPATPSALSPAAPGFNDSADVGECVKLSDGYGVNCVRPFASTRRAIINPSGAVPFPTAINGVQEYNASGAPTSPSAGFTTTLRGIVTTAPGPALTSRTYIEDAVAGIQILDAAPPTLALGDDVEVDGTISTDQGEIVIIPTAYTVFASGPQSTPRSLSLATLLDPDSTFTSSPGDFELVGQLLQTSGEIVEPFGAYAFGLSDGSNTVAVEFEAGRGFDSSDVNRRDSYQLTGILGIKNGVRVLRPRMQSDAVQLVDFGPNLIVSHSTLDFGTVPVGSYATQSFVLTNDGAPNTTTVGMVSTNCTDYQLLAGGGPFALAGGNSLTVVVRFLPSSAGNFVCQVATGDISVAVALSGTGEIASLCTVSTTEIIFPGLQVGLSAVDSFTVRNDGGGVLSGNLWSSSSEFMLIRGAGLFALASGESLTVEVQYTPTVAGFTQMDIGGSFFCAPVTVFGRAVDGPVFALRGDHSVGGATSAVTLEDYDRDGDMDLFLARRGAVAELYQNNAGGLDLIVPAAFPTVFDAYSGLWFDHGNDHRLDFYAGDMTGAGSYFENTSGIGFVEGTGQAISSIVNGRAVATADVDLDGDLDLFVPTSGSDPDRLLINTQPGGFFVDQALPAFAAGSVSTSGVWGDYDGDGDPDLYIVRFEEPNLLLRNDQGTWTDVTTPALADSAAGMDAAWGDYDNDGDLDLYLANLGAANRLYRNDSGILVDSTPTMLADSGRSSTPSWVDVDNDGDLDLCYPNGPGANGVFLNVGGEFYDGRLGPLASAANIVGMALADMDLDGDTDAYLADWDSTGANQLLENQTANGNHWLDFELYGVQSNAFGVGAIVRVVAAGTTQYRTVGAQHGSISRGSLRVHFGLGSATVVDTVEVRWPSGVVQTEVGTVADQVLHTTEGGSVTAVDPSDGSPRRTRLVGARPNPFNPQTEIDFDVAVPGRVELTVYDVAGRRVRRLLSEHRGPGPYSEIWDGKDDVGRRVSSGVYLVRLVEAGVETTIRVAMVK